jgi:hypothetical protein
MGVLSLVWTNLMQLEPDRTRRRCGSDEVPSSWPAMHERLIAAVEGAMTHLNNGARGRPSTDR